MDNRVIKNRSALVVQLKVTIHYGLSDPVVGIEWIILAM